MLLLNEPLNLIGESIKLLKNIPLDARYASKKDNMKLFKKKNFNKHIVSKKQKKINICWTTPTSAQVHAHGVFKNGHTNNGS